MPRRTLLIVLTLAVIWLPLAYAFYPAGSWVGHFELSVRASSDEQLESIRCRPLDDRAAAQFVVKQAEAGALPFEFVGGWTESTDPPDRALAGPGDTEAAHRLRQCVLWGTQLDEAGLGRDQPA